MKRFSLIDGTQKNLKPSKNISLPKFSESLEASFESGDLIQVDGTNVVRVPFGVRQSSKKRPERPERWITLIIPFNPPGSPTPPPQAA
tara:strand:+ start:254 stop:517 length:264 start_codon:yes stop_codon:yes gene_type:complete